MPRKRTKSYPGSITKRGATWRVRLWVAGKAHCYTVEGTRTDAQNYATNKHAELTGDAKRAAKGLPGAIRFSALVTEYRTHRLPPLAPNTQESYGESLDRFDAYFTALGDPLVREITRGDVTSSGESADLTVSENESVATARPTDIFTQVSEDYLARSDSTADLSGGRVGQTEDREVASDWLVWSWYSCIANQEATPSDLPLADAATTDSTSGLAADPALQSLDDRELTELEKANENRLRILARKYAREKLSREERARLEILTEYVRAHMPSVEPSEFAAVDAIENRRTARVATRKALMENLGIR